MPGGPGAPAAPVIEGPGGPCKPGGPVGPGGPGGPTAAGGSRDAYLEPRVRKGARAARDLEDVVLGCAELDLDGEAVDLSLVALHPAEHAVQPAQGREEDSAEKDTTEEVRNDGSVKETGDSSS
eukprot:2063828-Rhodomonas_salina.4